MLGVIFNNRLSGPIGRLRGKHHRGTRSDLYGTFLPWLLPSLAPSFLGSLHDRIRVGWLMGWQLGMESKHQKLGVWLGITTKMKKKYRGNLPNPLPSQIVSCIVCKVETTNQMGYDRTWIQDMKIPGDIWWWFDDSQRTIRFFTWGRSANIWRLQVCGSFLVFAFLGWWSLVCRSKRQTPQKQYFTLACIAMKRQVNTWRLTFPPPVGKSRLWPIPT